ncbi:unnamed protein product [Notodromas monacha]|uniref:Fork-head domain-containing protein n=1 Tax=Notodromas monacha TaxID=399045 RepID=A0A7R9BJZ6_9CRUS|nr:unnamed protein product [Notodromas monacha]CAG0916912.1 unnamed protein product [Notodromas monacha]
MRVKVEPGCEANSNSLPSSPVSTASPTSQSEIVPGMGAHPVGLTRPTATWPPPPSGSSSPPCDLSRLPFAPTSKPSAGVPFFMNPHSYAPLLQQLQSQRGPTAAPGMNFFVPTSVSDPNPSASQQSYYGMWRSSPTLAAMGILNPLVMPFGLLPQHMPNSLLPPHLHHLPSGFHPPEEPKPPHSYIGLIAMAILSSPDKKLVLSDIYQWILDHYAYFRTRGPGWRNSIRHNLSLNDCFMKAGRSANGKGHYWAIHPANISDFQRGDFRRRKAQRKVRRHMGLEPPGPDDEDDDDAGLAPAESPFLRHHPHMSPSAAVAAAAAAAAAYGVSSMRIKRTFDMASLLAPDDHNGVSGLDTAATREPASDEPLAKKERIDDEPEDNPRIKNEDEEDDEEIDVLSGGDADTTASEEKDDGDKSSADLSPSTNDKPALRQNFNLAAFYADYARARLAAAASLGPVAPDDVNLKAPLWFNPQGLYSYPATSTPGHLSQAWRPPARSPYLDAGDETVKDKK